jgi:phage-related baseplate assembly protein
MSGFSVIELDKLPVPDIIETLNYEDILQSMKADFIARDPSMAFVLELESEPAVKILEVAAYRELLIRQRINESTKAVMLAYAHAADLDNLGALFGVQRLLISEGDSTAFPPVDPVYEADNDYRRRIQLSLEGLSTAGPRGGYVFHSLSADGDVLDANATSPTPGNVLVTVLSRTGNGGAPAELLAAVDAILSAEDVRPLTDFITVQSATIVEYAITADLYFYNGPDSSVVIAEADSKLREYISNHHRIGHDITLSGIYAALHQPGVQRVELASPAADIILNETSAAYCTDIMLNHGGYDV